MRGLPLGRLRIAPYGLSWWWWCMLRLNLNWRLSCNGRLKYNRKTHSALMVDMKLGGTGNINVEGTLGLAVVIVDVVGMLDIVVVGPYGQ
ncbi:hypothetical protein CDL15_Pgr016931 [Punica granatum]|uniref:Uncharacterized protein n=1 Tax=Punica granatum TaxID=22663 RepID=A0A218WY17_PUNGR|nr:hypothetical protein CDL15_Pgr016931 [Punica granatum]PKI74747.1 hypothetical protein CRG98_004856 [Punica granatum]